ncbi:hypothetical protein [Helicobacter ailurogastricus]|uniref:hypothetical protein n=1 Tax=Helicobacter ailurogastricus TaxID=1578720 RepID=UPI0013150E50|nr:hypothetical protein [Helicobacter ailurogastricus]
MLLKSYLSQAILALFICLYALSKATFCNPSKYLSYPILPLKLISQAPHSIKSPHLSSQQTPHTRLSLPPAHSIKRLYLSPLKGIVLSGVKDLFLYLSATHLKRQYLSHQPQKAISCPVAPQAPTSTQSLTKMQNF